MDDRVKTAIREEIRELAQQMVDLEMWAREAYQKRKWVRVGELHQQRDEVREHRSELMRQIWEPKKRRASV